MLFRIPAGLPASIKRFRQFHFRFMYRLGLKTRELLLDSR